MRLLAALAGSDANEIDSALADFNSSLKNDQMREEETVLLSSVTSRQLEISSGVSKFSSLAYFHSVKFCLLNMPQS